LLSASCSGKQVVSMAEKRAAYRRACSTVYVRRARKIHRLSGEAIASKIACAQ
jgi:hypothetical protein